jgi:hypothetical protein|nr:hypothetical protein [Candidatus Aramenus sulfurataquae]
MKASSAVAALIVVVLLGAAYYLYEQGYFYTVTVIGINVEYTNNFLIKHVSFKAINTQISTHGGGTFQITLTFTDNGFLPVKLTSANVSAPFRLLYTSPPLPISLSPGNNVSITFSIKAPMESYTGTLTIYVNGTV